MAVMFRREGYLTTVAAHGLAALRILEQQRIDLLVTEVNMPILDGPRLAHCARAIIPDLPVLFLSGSANAAGWVPKHPHAKTAIVYKPFSLLNLLNTVEQLLEDRVAAGPRKGHAG
jgi:two-component system cell cycle response regulator CpdR